MERYYEYLKKFEKNFDTAIQNGWSRMIYHKDRVRLAEIYTELGGQGKTDIMCSKCMVELLKYVGGLYYEYKDNQLVEVIEVENHLTFEQAREEITEYNKQLLEKEVIPKPKLRGRKKKNGNNN